MAGPRSLMAASAPKTTSTTLGASPSDGRRSRSTSGSATRRGRSPAAAAGAGEHARLSRHGTPRRLREEVVDARVVGRRHRGRVRPARRGEGSPRCSPRKIRRPSGTSAMPLARLLGRRPISSRRRAGCAAHAGARPMIALQRRRLARAVGPIRPTISPGATVNERSRTACDAAVPNVETVTTNSHSSGTGVSPRYAQPRRRSRGSRSAHLRRERFPRRGRGSGRTLHDQRHVVVDQEHACVVSDAIERHDRGEVRHLCSVSPAPARRAARTWLRRQRACDTESSFVAVVRAVRRRVAVPGRARAGRRSRRAACRFTGVHRPPNAETSSCLTVGERAECVPALETWGQPTPARRCGDPVRHVVGAEMHRACVGTVEAADEVARVDLSAPTEPASRRS